MQFVTSINPNGRYERQRDCVNSWLNFKAPIYAIQLANEVEAVSKLFPDVSVLTAETVPTGLWSRQTPSINSLISLFKEAEVNTVLLNSDIRLDYSNPADFTDQISTNDQNVLVCGIRCDINERNLQSFNPFGIDVFVFKPGMLSLLPKTTFCLGMPGWDYWIPYCLVTQHSKQLRTIFDSRIEHVSHNDRWNERDLNKAWQQIGIHCKSVPKNITHWIQKVTGRKLWTHQSSYAHTQKILRGFNTVYEA